MRTALLLSFALLATAATLVAACGGSSSETPWPVEPEPAHMAPSQDLTPLPAGEEDAGARRTKE